MAVDTKIQLRKALKAKRSSLSSSQQIHYSRLVCENISTLEAYQPAKSIALYQAIRGEIDMHSIWLSSLKQNKTCFFPTLNPDQTLSFLPADLSTQWKKNRFGILEPIGTKEQAVSPERLDVLFIPLLGFDCHGNRIGMGAGYYDRTLARSKAGLLAGVAYEFQRITDIQPEPWDIPLDVIITENNIYWSKP